MKRIQLSLLYLVLLSTLATPLFPYSPTFQVDQISVNRKKSVVECRVVDLDKLLKENLETFIFNNGGIKNKILSLSSSM
jgi:cell division septal protein FtsQ